MYTRIRLFLAFIFIALPGQAVGQATTLTHSSSLEITESGVSCGQSVFMMTSENHYWRVFDLSTFGVANDFTVTSIDLGIGNVNLRGTTQPSTLRIHALTGAFTLANLTVLHEQVVELQDALGMSLLNVPVDNVVIAGGTSFVVEWEPIDGTPNDDHGPLEVKFGANNAGQTGPSYIYAPACGDEQPMDLAEVGPGFPDSHWVLAVNGAVSTAVEEEAVPAAFTLGQNYPNPFNPTTTIPFFLRASSTVSLKVFDVKGNEVATLLDGAFAPGPHEAAFDAAGLPSGVYFYRLQAGGEARMKPLLLVK